MLDNSFFPRTWRGEEQKITESELSLPLGEYDLVRVEKKFTEVISNFIRSIFNYKGIKVDLKKISNKNKSVTAYSSGSLEEEDGHLKYLFAAKLFNDQFYEFSIKNIPATSTSNHIKLFFSVLVQYILYFYENIKNNLPIEEGRLKASQSFIAKSEIWLYNIQRTIIIEYLYNLFNYPNWDYSNPITLTPRKLTYNLDFINTILDFSYELSSRKVENKEIYCGFIFHDSLTELDLNSVRIVKFENQFDFGDFGQIKNYLEVSNGQNIFFNVTGKKITHLIITKDKLNEIFLNPIGLGKTFQSRPLLLSIQGNGKIFFVEGRTDQNKVILQIINSKPIIRDNDFIKQFIYENIKKVTAASEDQLRVFSKWVMSLSQKKHGTSLLFLDSTDEINKKLVKSVKISINTKLFEENAKLRYDLSFLDSIVNPDGAVIFNTKLEPTHISAILPIAQNAKGTNGGARHNSIKNFSNKFDCLGIVISEDGPITIFKDGKILIKF